MGDYDVPATVSLVLEKTGNQKVSFIGHSQGNTMMFAAMSEKADWYRERINLFVALAPTVRLINVRSTAIKAAAGNMLVHKMIEMAGGEIYPEPNVENKLMKFFLKVTNLDDLGLDIVSDDHPEFIDDKAKMCYFGHYPSGTSSKSLIHVLQIAETSKFARYDYGESENMMKYGQKEAPEYDMKKITDFPVALFCGIDDLVSSP